jgi:hypothetical protein
MLVPILFSQITRVLEAIQKQFDAHLGVTQSMPHVKIPIGLSKEAMLDTMADSCAGLNLGRLSYHESIRETHPELVHQFAYIKDLEHVNEFAIGGVEHDGPGITVTALITYKTPFKVNGAPVLITFALSDGSAANSIIGLPFLRATKSAFFLDSDGQDTLVIQKFGATFKVDYHAPMIGSRAPQTDKESQANYTFSTNDDRWVSPVTLETDEHTDALRLHLARSVERPSEEIGMDFEQAQGDEYPNPEEGLEMPPAQDVVYISDWHE